MRPYVSAALLLLLLALAKMEEHGGRDNDMFLLQDGQYVKSLLEEELTRESYEVSKLERKGEEEENQKTVLQHEEGEEERGKVRLVKNVNHQVILLEVREEGDYYPSANYTADEEEDREGGGVHDEDGDDEEEGKIQDNCTHPRQPFPWYNDSCDFVHAECGGKSELIDYLAFVLCDLPKAQPVGYVVMGVWLIYLISLLATTVDIFFVPPLNYLSEKLNLTPSVAGVTLMALGNGAPDIFVVFSAISQNDLALVLGSLTGAAIFITTVVLGTVMLVSKVWPYKLDKIDFMRDIIAFIVVVGTVIGVAYDGAVYLVEACIFPLVYIIYIAGVVALSYFRAWVAKKTDPPSHLHQSNSSESCKVPLCEDSVEKEKERLQKESIKNSLREVSRSYRSVFSMSSTALEKMPLTKGIKDTSTKSMVKDKEEDVEKEEEEEEEDDEEAGAERTICYLHGISWPKGSIFFTKIIWFIQWPFSLLRWFTIPSFYHDHCWSVFHYLFTSFSPLPIVLLMLIAVRGWKGFSLTVGPIPLPILLLGIAALPSVFLFVTLRPHRPPHWTLQLVLVPAAFIMAIIWLNIMANEIVSIMRAFGLLLNIDTAILGLTVLALGNCVADWVADTVVARAGKPEMAFASCFGSPLLSHVLGLSIAMIVKIGFYNHGEPFRFHIHTLAYSQVKLSWIFLGTSLIASAVIFPAFKFSPPRLYGVLLICLYFIFVVFAVLGETQVLPVHL